MALLGLAATFLPQELAAAAGISGGALVALSIQITGALYLGFAMTNWMAKGSAIGGIYNRPLSVGNLLHFFVAAAALGKFVARGNHAPVLVALTVIYIVFALAFVKLVFGTAAIRRVE
jgi:hypothetical protein